MTGEVGYRPLQELPLEILAAIISRCPMKTILQFRSVSKAFSNFISSPYFTRIYRNNVSINSITILGQMSSLLPSLNLVELHKQSITSEDTCIDPSSLTGDKETCSQFSVLGYCNGLICLLKLELGFYNLYVTNPIFRDFIQLPQPLAHCTDSYIANGLGYCQQTNRYKVLRIIRVTHLGQTNYGAEIVTLGVDETWRTVAEYNVPHDQNVRKQSSCMVAFDSALHWLFRTRTEPQTRYISTFNMTEETFGELQLPEELVSRVLFDGYLRVFLGKLCLFDHFLQSMVFNIWVLVEYGVEGSWTKHFILEISASPEIYRLDSMDVMMLSDDGLIVISDSRKFLFFDMKASKFLMTVHRIKTNFCLPISFLPSFVSLRNMIKHNDHLSRDGGEMLS